MSFIYFSGRIHKLNESIAVKLAPHEFHIMITWEKLSKWNNKIHGDSVFGTAQNACLK